MLLTSEHDQRQGSAAKAYEVLRQRAMTYYIRPDERINEVEVARELNVSRTPLREALNRLTAEGLLTFTRNRGFSGRSLKPKEIFDLYECRRELEASIVRLACERATPEELDEIAGFLAETAVEGDATSIDRLVQWDVEFHERVAALSRNAEMLNVLRSINARIYFARWVDMDGRRDVTQREHRELIGCMRDRCADEAVRVITRHIERRLDQITDVIRRGYAQIYVPSPQPTLNHDQRAGR